MANNDDGREVYLKQVRLSYPHLLKKQKANPDAKPKFSASFLIDPETEIGAKNIAKIEEAMDAACMLKWKKPYSKMRFKQDRCCFFDGNDALDKEGNVKGGYADMMVIKASDDNLPDLRHRNIKTEDKGRVQLTKVSDGEYNSDDNPFYGGCYVEAILRLYGTDNGGAPGLFASLKLVRFIKKGEAFGAPPVDDSILDDYEDEDEDEDDDGILD